MEHKQKSAPNKSHEQNPFHGEKSQHGRSYLTKISIQQVQRTKISLQQVL